MTKILLVEDDKSLREIYGVRLLAEGYDIVSAGDGEEALSTAIKENPDLIISDVMMPKISGFDMLDILKSNASTKNIKVIMMTALSSDDQRERGKKLGADRYLVKSQVGVEDVVNVVHEVLEDENVARKPIVAPVPPAASDEAEEKEGAADMMSVPSEEGTATETTTSVPNQAESRTEASEENYQQADQASQNQKEVMPQPMAPFSSGAAPQSQVDDLLNKYQTSPAYRQNSETVTNNVTPEQQPQSATQPSQPTINTVNSEQQPVAANNAYTAENGYQEAAANYQNSQPNGQPNSFEAQNANTYVNPNNFAGPQASPNTVNQTQETSSPVVEEPSHLTQAQAFNAADQTMDEIAPDTTEKAPTETNVSSYGNLTDINSTFSTEEDMDTSEEPDTQNIEPQQTFSNPASELNNVKTSYEESPAPNMNPNGQVVNETFNQLQVQQPLEAPQNVQNPYSAGQASYGITEEQVGPMDQPEGVRHQITVESFEPSANENNQQTLSQDPNLHFDADDPIQATLNTNNEFAPLPRMSDSAENPVNQQVQNQAPQPPAFADEDGNIIPTDGLNQTLAEFDRIKQAEAAGLSNNSISSMQAEEEKRYREQRRQQGYDS